MLRTRCTQEFLLTRFETKRYYFSAIIFLMKIPKPQYIYGKPFLSTIAWKRVFNHLSHKSMHHLYIKIIFCVFHDSKEDEIQKKKKNIKCTSFMTVHSFRVHPALEEIAFKS